MLQAVCLALALGAAVLGSIIGIGGGVVMKPVLDATGMMSVATASFLSSVSVLAMALVSMARGKADEIERDKTPALGIGAALGGVLGKLLFDGLKARLGQPDAVGAVQAALLIFVTVIVMLYVPRKETLKGMRVSGFAACFGIGAMLGLVSSFLSIGGGPLNLAVLFLFFSMPTKKAAANSLLIVLFSQGANLLLTLARGLPPFDPPALGLMVAGGFLGGMAGSALAKRMSAGAVERLFMASMFVIVGINIYNLIRFLG